jgi:S-adenosylhomocysteine hydrolase
VSASARPLSLTAYGLYRGLVQGRALPASAQKALAEIEARLDRNGGTLRRRDLDGLENDLARTVARAALNHKAIVERLDRGLPVAMRSWTDVTPLVMLGLPRLHEEAAAADPRIDRSEIDRDWFAAYFARAMAIESFGAATSWAGQGPPRASDVLSFVAPEMNRLRAIVLELEALPSRHPRRRELVSARDAAAKDVLLAACFGYTDARSLARAAERAPPAVKDALTAVERRTSGTTTRDSPEIPAALLRSLGRRSLYGVQVSAPIEQQAELGDMPVLAATVDALKDMGLLGSETFAGLEVGVRTHLLPSLERLAAVLASHGADHLHVVGKGVSTSPMTALGVRRLAQTVEPGIGDSAQTPSAHQAGLVREMKRWVRAAKAGGRQLLILGDGRDTAQAALRVADRSSGVRVGYVEFTQSGISFLSDVPGELPLDVDSFADTLLKTMAESGVLGPWLVDYEIRMLAKEKRDQAELDAVCVGYGRGVGRSTALALRDRRFRNVVVVEPDHDRAELAREEGFTVVESDRPADLPKADYYFSCVGRDAVIGRAALERMPDGATVVNCASRYEVDEAFLIAARRGRLRRVRARPLERRLLPDHRTLAVRFQDHTVRVRKMGQPFFDGIADKDPRLVDVYMAGLLASMCSAAGRLKGPRTEPARIRTLGSEIQRRIAASVEAIHPGWLPESLHRALAG